MPADPRANSPPYPEMCHASCVMFIFKSIQCQSNLPLAGFHTCADLSLALAVPGNLTRFPGRPLRHSRNSLDGRHPPLYSRVTKAIKCKENITPFNKSLPFSLSPPFMWIHPSSCARCLP